MNYDEVSVEVDPLDYIMGRLWGSGKFHEVEGTQPLMHVISYDDLKQELSNILCFDNLEGVD